MTVLCCLRSLLADYKNIVISDRYSAYNTFDSSQRQICWAHLKRDFTKLSEKQDKPISRIGKKLLFYQSKLFVYWHEYKSNQISRYQLQQSSKFIRNAIGELLEQGSYTDPSLKAARFCKNLLDSFNALWTFIYNDNIEPTNNHAERCLRPLVIWRKKYFGTRSNSGSEFVARTASINTTCRLQNINIFEYISELIKNYFAGKPAPQLLLAHGG